MATAEPGGNIVLFVWKKKHHKTKTQEITTTLETPNKYTVILIWQFLCFSEEDVPDIGNPTNKDLPVL